MTSSKIANPSLASQGVSRLEWARERMPIVTGIEEEFRRTKPFDGIRIGICLHVEPKTGIWLQALRAGGAEIAITGSPGTTADDIAAALVEEFGVSVFARQDETFEDHMEFARDVLRAGPDLIADNGADLHALCQTEFPELLSSLAGATEETTSGGYRLREDLDQCPFPTIVINDSRAKRIIENRYGVGQSVVDAIMRTTNILLGGLNVAVIGYGYCGRGVALCFRNLGAHVSVVDIDPLTALDAHLEGFAVVEHEKALAEADLVVTVTGRNGTITGEQFGLLKDGAIVANAGHFEFELDVKGLRGIAGEPDVIRGGIERYDIAGKKLFVLGRGRPINLAMGEGNPIEVMDLGLALQSLSLEYLVKHQGTLSNTVGNIPTEVENRVAKLALDAWT